MGGSLAVESVAGLAWNTQFSEVCLARTLFLLGDLTDNDWC
jgi:hypothetical protein